jgi:L-ribulose-5-phosphate 3-epimerase
VNTISFMSANYVARQVNYDMPEGWAQGDRATQAHFQPIDTYADRLGEIFRDIKAIGFDTIDLWGGHLNPRWATPDHFAIARDLLQQHSFTVASLAGWWDTLADFEGSCKIANAVGARILGGGGSIVRDDHPGVVRLLDQFDLVYGFENHPEKSADEVLEKIGDSAGGRVGVALDTGWFGTHNCDAVEMVQKLRDRIVYVHLKDVRAVGTHETCRYGEGVVPLQGVVEALKASGYTGGYTVEHEPHHGDPTEDIIASAAMLRQWLA